MEILRDSLEKRNCFLCASHIVPDGNVSCILRSFRHWKGRQSYSCLFLNCCVMLPQVISLAVLSTSKPSVKRHASYICQAYTVRRGKMKNLLIGKPYWLFSLGHSLFAGHPLPDVTPYRKVECLPEREMLLPTGEGKLPPLCRSSIDRLQGLDFSIEFSTLFSKLSKSNLTGNRKSNAGSDRKDAHFPSCSRSADFTRSPKITKRKEESNAG